MAAPSTGLLDNFNRTDANPISGNWATFTGFTANPLKNLSNQATGTSAGTSGSYYNASTYGPDCDFYATVTSLNTTDGSPHINIFARIQNPTLSTFDAYRLQINFKSGGTLDQWFIQSYIAGSSAVIAGPTTGPDIAVGDRVWFNPVGSLLTGYHDPGGVGTWNQVIQVTDANVTAAGYGALVLPTVNPAADDFSGGTSISTSVSLPAWPRIRFNG